MGESNVSGRILLRWGRGGYGGYGRRRYYGGYGGYGRRRYGGYGYGRYRGGYGRRGYRADAASVDDDFRDYKDDIDGPWDKDMDNKFGKAFDQKRDDKNDKKDDKNREDDRYGPMDGRWNDDDREPRWDLMDRFDDFGPGPDEDDYYYDDGYYG